VWHTTVATFNATPAYDPSTGAVFAGGANGTLYKFDAASGSVLAQYNAGAALNKSTIVAGGAVYTTDVKSNLHKVDPATLARQWLYTSGCTAQCDKDTPPAYSPSRNAIVYASGDLYVHAVNATTGARNWAMKPTTHSPTFPFQFGLGWPVIAEKHGLVLLRMQSQDSYIFDSGIFPTTNSAIRSYLQANPQYQTLFTLSLDSGTSAFVPAVGYGSIDALVFGVPGYADGSFYRQMPGQPVVKVWPNGDETVYMQFRNGIDNPPDSRWDAHMGEMVLDSTTVSGLQAGDMRFVRMSRYGLDNGNAYTFISDEEFPLTMAGSSLFFTSFTGTQSIKVTDRSPSLGLDHATPISTTAHPPILRRVVPCGTFSPSTHWANCTGLTLFDDGRYWNGSGFWWYWNQMDPGPISGALPWDVWSPRYSYVSNGLLIIEGDVGDLLILRHAAS
jgi:PQQ-like domain